MIKIKYIASLYLVLSMFCFELHAQVKYNAVEGRDDLPFSDSVEVGKLVFLSGKLGNVAGTNKLVEGGIGPETRQTMEHIKSSLDRVGLDMSHVVKCTVFLADIAEWAAMNEVYRTYFENPPARSALGSSGLALGARVEIECIAARPESQQ
ncbi:MAG: hypothetical protein DHS20C11_34850 [Lysobacteraceae bacterium]|nr:MAG: hypothetical protein DHS20C11_34850 [Xanthomonadaceae bacterium]